MLQIADISEPAEPQVVGESVLVEPVIGIAVQDGYAYVAEGLEGLRVIDVSEPTSPVEAGFYATHNNVKGVEV